MLPSADEGPILPLELPGLVEIGSREYAGQVPETQAWRGGWGFREGQEGEVPNRWTTTPSAEKEEPVESLGFLLKAVSVLSVATLIANAAHAQQAGGAPAANAEELAKKLSNPVADLVNVPFQIGPFPMSIGAGAGYYVESPAGGPDWKLRFQVTLILPRKK